MYPASRFIPRASYPRLRAFELTVSSGLLLIAELAILHAAPRGQIVELGTSLCEDMKHTHVIAPSSPVGCDRLKLVRFDYFDFGGNIHHDGEVVVMDAAAEKVLDSFEALAETGFPISGAKLLNAYGGSDEASMADNNTSAFNNRPIKGSTDVSLHAYGLALDINPIQNPYVRINAGNLEFSPPAGSEYTDRSNRRPGMTEAAVEILAHNGFMIWGGDWSNPIDYQHFQVGRGLAKMLTRLSSKDAKAAFDRYVVKCRDCLRTLARPECVKRLSEDEP